MTAAKKETLRWGVGRRADTEAAREKILDAALYCYQKYTLSETCMKQIAQEAKVSRQTLYRHFKNRDDIVLSLIIRELEGILLNIKDQLPTDSSFAEFIVESIAIADEKIRLSPIFELMINGSAMLMERVHCYAKHMLTVSGMYFHERFNAAKNNGELRSGIEYDEFVTWLYRVGTSFIVLPQNEQRIDCIRPVLWRYLIPAFTRIDAPPTLADTAA